MGTVRGSEDTEARGSVQKKGCQGRPPSTSQLQLAASSLPRPLKVLSGRQPKLTARKDNLADCLKIVRNPKCTFTPAIEELNTIFGMMVHMRYRPF